MFQWVPILISALALLVSIVFAVMTMMDRRASMRLNRQRVLADWATQVLEEMSAAYHWIMAKEHKTSPSPDRKTEILARLSYLIDEGRWYFPNDRSLRFGLHKHELNHGIRDDVLDPPVAMYRFLAEIDPLPKDLNDCRKDFAAKIANMISPFETDGK